MGLCNGKIDAGMVRENETGQINEQYSEARALGSGIFCKQATNPELIFAF